MTPDEQRLALMTGACPECGHSVLNHRRGLCHCGCKAIQPPNSQGSQMVIDELAPALTPKQWALIEHRLKL